jgi:hypothetical protein
VAAGVVPPLEIDHQQRKAVVVEHKLDPVRAAEWSSESGVDYEVAPPPKPASTPTPPEHEQAQVAEPVSTPVSETTSGATEYAPPPEPVAVPEDSGGSSSSGASSGSPAGEFGP